MKIESPKNFKACGCCTDCEHQVTYDMNSRDTFYYQQGRADELDKITKMMLLGCEELECEECVYRIYSQDVCQQAYTFGMIGKYIEEQLKEQK